MIQRIDFGTYVINSSRDSNYNIVSSSGFDSSLRANFINVPRSNYSRFISAYAGAKSRSIAFLMTAPNKDLFLTQENELYALTGKELTFTVYKEIHDNGYISSHTKLQFDGVITSVRRVNEATGQLNFGDYEIVIESQSPFLNAISPVTETVNIQPAGFTFPFTFPFVFSGASDTITVTNNGTADGYPTITLAGQGTTWDITNITNTDLANQTFTYRGTILDGNAITINPIDTDPEKVRDQNGNVFIQNTNSNWEVFLIPAGESVTFSVAVASGINNNATFSMSFRNQYWGI